MRKIFGVLLSVLCICCAAIGLTGCKKDKHIHAFDKQVITDEYKATDQPAPKRQPIIILANVGRKERKRLLTARLTWKITTIKT